MATLNSASVDSSASTLNTMAPTISPAPSPWFPSADPSPAPSYLLCNTSLVCGTGNFINTSESRWRCEACPAGTYSAYPRARFCETCPAGYHAPIGARECKQCVAGTASGPRSRNCSLCPPGTATDAGAESCPACPAGYFSKVWGSSSCESCDSNLGYHSAARAVRCDICLPGYVFNNATGLCLVCASEGVECSRSGVTLEMLLLRSGWWRPNQISTSIYACRTESCLGGGGWENRSDDDDGDNANAANASDDNMGARRKLGSSSTTEVHDYCMTGYTGPFCTVCDHGYFSGSASFDKCVSCSGVFWWAILPLIIIIIVVLVFYNQLSAMYKSLYLELGDALTVSLTAKGRIIMSTYQMIAQYIAFLEVTFPEPFASFLVTKSFFTLDIGSLLPIKCLAAPFGRKSELLAGNAHSRLIVATVVPFALALYIAVSYAKIAHRARRETLEERQRQDLQRQQGVQVSEEPDRDANWSRPRSAGFGDSNHHSDRRFFPSFHLAQQDADQSGDAPNHVRSLLDRMPSFRLHHETEHRHSSQSGDGTHHVRSLLDRMPSFHLTREHHAEGDHHGRSLLHRVPSFRLRGEHHRANAHHRPHGSAEHRTSTTKKLLRRASAVVGAARGSISKGHHPHKLHGLELLHAELAEIQKIREHTLTPQAIERAKALSNARRRHIQAFLWLTYLALPTTTTHIFSMFLCTEVDEATLDGRVHRRYLRTDMSIDCDSKIHERMEALAVVSCG